MTIATELMALAVNGCTALHSNNAVANL
ncbi:hypothetical protein SPRA44_640145 [Serratia proteamaculans]|nr:hypothetical protein SPRA44_640145 [Serratia proteamaculans]